MQRCGGCGSKISDAAKYCPVCGARIGREENRVDGPGSSLGKQVESEAALGGLSFKDRIIEFRRTTLKAIPTFVLAIIALLVATGTAYAAYRVVKDVIMPSIERVADSSKEGHKADEKPKESPEAKKARAAFEDVLDEYRTLYRDHEEEIKASEDGTYLFDAEVKYAVAVGYMIDESGYSYAYVDVDSDDIDELLVSFGENLLVCCYDYVDGEIVQFCAGWDRNPIFLTKDLTFIGGGSGAFDFHAYNEVRWNGHKEITLESVMEECVDDNDRGESTSPYRFTHMKDGEEKSEVMSYDRALAETYKVWDEMRARIDDKVEWTHLDC